MRKPCLVLKSSGHVSVADFVRIAEFVKVEQFGRQGFAARMSLTLVLIDPDFQLARHFLVFPVAFATCVFCQTITMRRRSASVEIAAEPHPFFVIAGRSRLKDGVASARLCPAIHVFATVK